MAGLLSISTRRPSSVGCIYKSVAFVMVMTAVVNAVVPVTYTISHRNYECLYDTVREDEYVTISVFITSGSELRATAILEGPVAPLSANSGQELLDAVTAYDRGSRYADRRHTFTKKYLIDFENLRRRHSSSHSRSEADDDDDINLDDDNQESEDKEEKQGGDTMTEEQRLAMMEKRNAALVEKKKARIEEAKRRAQEKAKERERRRQERQRNQEDQDQSMNEGEPFQRTIQAQADGWYRVCLNANWYQISAEMEMRKSSELGPPNRKTGHVISYDEHTMLKQERELFGSGNEKDSEELQGVKDEDLRKTKDQLRLLNRLLSEIKQKQQNERHRLSVHAATNEHSHSRMVLSSLFETIFYMIVSGFQVYTIRKWFSGAPILGV